MDHNEQDFVVIESANRHNPSLFGAYGNLPIFHNVDAAINYFRLNPDTVKSTQTIFRVRRINDDKIWEQPYIELAANL